MGKTGRSTFESGIDQELDFGHTEFDGLIRYSSGKSRERYRLEIAIVGL